MPHVEANGIDTFYKDDSPSHGHSRGTVVLVHGHSADHTVWRYQLPALVDAGYRAVRYDVRGHGRSSVPTTGYTWENYSADLAALLDHLKVDAAHIVGSSMGGGIALQFALDHPPTVRSLTLVDTALPGFTYSDEFASHIEQLVEAVLAYPAADYREGAVPDGYQPDITDHVREIAAPALVIAGENDIPDFRLVAEILAANLPNARRITIPSCWHLPMLEEPDEFNEALLAFLDTLS